MVYQTEIGQGEILDHEAKNIPSFWPQSGVSTPIKTFLSDPPLRLAGYLFLRHPEKNKQHLLTCLDMPSAVTLCARAFRLSLDSRSFNFPLHLTCQCHKGALGFVLFKRLRVLFLVNFWNPSWDTKVFNTSPNDGLSLAPWGIY